jgi:hypothetical protein
LLKAIDLCNKRRKLLESAISGPGENFSNKSCSFIAPPLLFDGKIAHFCAGSVISTRCESVTMQRRLSTLSLSIAMVAFSAIVALAAGGVFNSWKGYSKGDEVVLEWRTENEQGLRSFEIERKSPETVGYSRIGIVVARGGANSYSFTDRSAFYKSQGGKQFTYRIKAVGNTEEYSPGIVVTHEVASVRRSWGMIKELFR